MGYGMFLFCSYICVQWLNPIAAGARFTDSLIRALNGETGVVEPTFVKSPLYESEGVEYFASNVELGPEGVKKINPVGQLSAEEQELLKACLPEYVLFLFVWRVSLMIQTALPRTSRRALTLSRLKFNRRRVMVIGRRKGAYASCLCVH